MLFAGLAQDRLLRVILAGVKTRPDLKTYISEIFRFYCRISIKPAVSSFRQLSNSSRIIFFAKTQLTKLPGANVPPD